MFKSNRHFGIQLANERKPLLSRGQTSLNQVGRQVGSVLMLALKMLHLAWQGTTCDEVNLSVCLRMIPSVRSTRWTKTTAAGGSKPRRDKQNCSDTRPYLKHPPATSLHRTCRKPRSPTYCVTTTFYSVSKKSLFPSVHSPLRNYSDAYDHK